MSFIMSISKIHTDRRVWLVRLTHAHRHRMVSIATLIPDTQKRQNHYWKNHHYLFSTPPQSMQICCCFLTIVNNNILQWPNFMVFTSSDQSILRANHPLLSLKQAFSQTVAEAANGNYAQFSHLQTPKSLSFSHNINSMPSRKPFLLNRATHMHPKLCLANTWEL